MKALEHTAGFKRDFRKSIRRGQDPLKLVEVLAYLLSGEELPTRFRDHALQGEFRGLRDCHVSPDWLLLYKTDGETVTLISTGSHSDLFG